MKHLINLIKHSPSLIRRTMMYKFLYIRRTSNCAVLLIPLLAPNIVQAEIIDTYLGMNFINSTASVPEVQLQKIAYIGANGASITVAIPVLTGNSPFDGSPLTGLPDGNGLSAVPTYTTITSGDGETTRSFNETVAIDWDTSDVIPTIQITDIEVYVTGIGVWTAQFGTPYTVGLIPNNEVDTELDSTFATPQGDIYGELISSPGNAVGSVIATSAPTGYEGYVGSAFGEFIFSATWGADPVEKVGELATDVIELNIKVGIASSLDAKLDTIIKTMEQAKKKDRAAVAEKLGAFINEVDAQSGKAIAVEEAIKIKRKAELIKWGWKKKKYI